MGWPNKFTIPRRCGFLLVNLQKGPMLDVVPEENLGKNLEELCIRWGSLKYLDDEIVHANSKKPTPKLVTVIAVILRYAGSVGQDF